MAVLRTRATVSETGGSAFAVRIEMGAHEVVGDEPVSAGGGGLGPNPFDLMTAALAECTAMTVRWFAREHDWPLDHVEVVVDHAKKLLAGASEPVDVFDKTIFLRGPRLDESQRRRLMDVATKCPVYADPEILFLPARLMILACGLACVLLTWRLGRRLGGPKIGLIAAAFLAVNAVHVQYSQVVRTDVQASVFVLLCLLASLGLFRTGRRRAYLLAGLAVGLGVATKWPAAAVALSPVTAALWRIAQGHRELGRLALFCAASLGSLLLASPYLLLDYPTVLHNLEGETRAVHPGQAGTGVIDNLVWYAAHPLLGSLGTAGLVLAASGTVWLALRHREAAVAVLPGMIACAAILCFQALRWERWVIPLLPAFAIAAAFALCRLSDWLRTLFGRRLALLEPVAALLLSVPMVHATVVAAAERMNDTRQIASAWLRDNAPMGSSVLVEHAALDLLQGDWRLRFPLGSAGCVDARAALAGRIRYAEVERSRSNNPIVDLGHVDAARLASCRADFAVFTHHERYTSERFGPELERYRKLAEGGIVRAVIRPARGVRGGPSVFIVQLAP